MYLKWLGTGIGFLVALLVFLYAVDTLGIAYPVRVTTTMRADELAVNGEGQVTVVPDSAAVTVGITVTAVPTTAAAQEAIAAASDKVIAAWTRQGIPKSDIKTLGYSISQNRVFTGGTTTVNGYDGNETLEAKTGNTATIPQLISAATAAGANEITGVQYTVDKPEQYRERARSAAITNAKNQAAALAKSLGLRLGKITNIVEASAPSPIPFVGGMGGAGTAPAVEAGTQTVTSVVTLYFEKL
jgi:uncharacterized protein YggE